MRKKIVVFAPHPDDETLGCGGTIAKKIDSGYEVFIVFLTDGRYALKEVGVVSERCCPLKMKDLRKRDALKASKVLGLPEENLFFLEIEDKTLQKHRKYAENKIVRILMDVNPTEIYLPQKMEYNLDHQMTNLIVREALKNSGLNPIEYQYTIAWKFPFYILKHILNERSFDILTCKLLKCKLVRVDISQYLPIKKMAILAYRSQLSLLFDGQSRPALKPSFISHFLRNKEKFFVKLPKN